MVGAAAAGADVVRCRSACCHGSTAGVLRREAACCSALGARDRRREFGVERRARESSLRADGVVASGGVDVGAAAAGVDCNASCFPA